MAFELSPAITGGIAGGIAIPIVFKLIRKLPSFQVEAPTNPENIFPQLATKYTKWEQLSVIPIFIFTGVFTYLYCKLFIFLSNVAHLGVGESTYFLYPTTTLWFLPAFFLAIVTSAIPCHYLYSFLLRERYDEYTLYCNLRHGFDGWKFLKKMSLVLIVAIFIFFPFIVDWYTRVTPSKIGVNEFFGFGEKHYKYQDINEIRRLLSFKAPSGNIVRRIHHEIEFSDGFIWSSQRNPFELRPKQENEIIEYISVNGKKEINTIDPFPIK